MTPSHSNAPTRGLPEPAPEEILRSVRAVVAGALHRPVEEVGADLSLEYGLGVDSMALIEIHIALEQHFHIAMPDFVDPTGVAGGTVADLAAIVAARLKGNSTCNGRQS